MPLTAPSRNTIPPAVVVMMPTLLLDVQPITTGVIAMLSPLPGGVPA